MVVYSDDPSASLDLISPASWALREVRGEWRGRSAGGCRNYPSWVMNPLYSLRAPRDTQCEVFLRQPEKPPLPAADGAYGTTDPTYDGVGFYVTRDDGELNLEDVEAQSGFERAQEVSGHCDLRANQVRATRRRPLSPNHAPSHSRLTPPLPLRAPHQEYLLIPMTYKRKVQLAYEIELYSDVDVQLTLLSPAQARRRRPLRHRRPLRPPLPHPLRPPPRAVRDAPPRPPPLPPQADSRRLHSVRHEAAVTVQRAFVCKRFRKLLRARDYERAKQLVIDWFSKPSRDTDEGYLDINLALNALESAFIQLTGKPDAKGHFFPRMRKRLEARGHKVADYDVCL